MPHTDTLFVVDSTTCKFIDFEHFPARTNFINPVSSIWSASTLVPSVKNTRVRESDLEKNIISGIVFVYFIVLIFFIRQIVPVFYPLISTIWSYKNNVKIEEKTGLSYKRNVTAWLALIFIPIVITATSGSELKSIYGLFTPYIIAIILAGIIAVWIIRGIIFQFVSWLTKDKITFKAIEKISYNYFIIGSILVFLLLIIRLISGDITSDGMINSFLKVFVFSYLLYIFRTFQVIRSHHFSIVFYILYLCAVEILPLSILTNIILVL